MDESHAAASEAKIKYEIDGKEVSSVSYYEFINQLLTEKINWFCRDESTGGTTGYELKDKAGNNYKIVETTRPNNQVYSIKAMAKK